MSRWFGLHVVSPDDSDNPRITGTNVRVWDVVHAYDGGEMSQQIAQSSGVPLATVQTILSFAHRYLPEKGPHQLGCV